MLIRARLHETLLPAPDTRLGRASEVHNLVGANARGRQQHDLGAPDMLLWTVSIRRNCDEAGAVRRAEGEGDTGEHPADSHDAIAAGSPFRTLPSGVVH